MNPYEADLGDREPLDVLEFSPRNYRALVDRAGAEPWGRRLGPGRWTVAQLLLHLVQTELVMGMRFRFALATREYVAQRYDQDDWVGLEPGLPGRELLQLWDAVRRLNLALIRSLSAEQRQRAFVHPERGRLTVWEYVETLAGHDLRHFRQLRAMVEGA